MRRLYYGSEIFRDYDLDNLDDRQMLLNLAAKFARVFVYARVRVSDDPLAVGVVKQAKFISDEASGDHRLELYLGNEALPSLKICRDLVYGIATIPACPGQHVTVTVRMT